MKVVLFGATGMIGSGVLIECLVDPEITSVVSITRRQTGTVNPKLWEIVHDDFTNFSALRGVFTGADACFFCLGISSIGLSESEYHAITYDVALAAARVMAEVSPGMTFCFVSGTGSDSTEKGSVMWARVKGKTENAIMALPFRHSFIFRPGIVQPLKGARSRTKLYRALYTIMSPVTPVLRNLFPRYITTTENVGRAMINVARRGYDKRILENADIERAAIDVGLAR